MTPDALLLHLDRVAAGQIPAGPTEWAIKTLAPFPAKSAESPARIAWLRIKIHSYAWYLACLDLAGVAHEECGDMPARSQLVMAATRMAQHSNLPYPEGVAAARAEWAECQARALVFVDRLRAAVYPLARDRASGEVILAAATRVSDAFDCALPTPLLTMACQVIAESTQQPQRARRR